MILEFFENAMIVEEINHVLNVYFHYNKVDTLLINV